jgi:hypothetical protein
MVPLGGHLEATVRKLRKIGRHRRRVERLGRHAARGAELLKIAEIARVGFQRMAREPALGGLPRQMQIDNLVPALRAQTFCAASAAGRSTSPSSSASRSSRIRATSVIFSPARSLT